MQAGGARRVVRRDGEPKTEGRGTRYQDGTVARGTVKAGAQDGAALCLVAGATMALLAWLVSEADHP
jgi:hypothetical protein